VREPDGFRDFVAARYAALVRFGTLLTNDAGHGEDLVQVALVKTLRAWRRIHPDGDAEAYARRVMARDAWRASRRRWRGEVPTADLPDVGTPDPYEQFVNRDAAERLLSVLPAQQRVVLTLRYWADLSEAEIAEQLGCSVGTVKSRASRALTTLRTAGALTGPALRNGADR
jgi:RNA polymerase sigma-70 factor (sigma-E family)